MKAFRAPQTISESIYQYLRQAIVDGQLKPNQRLQDKEIAARFNVSPTPVREAFLRLAAEKYLQMNARREVVVQGKTTEEARELLEIVRVLDLYAVKEYARNLTDKDLQVLRDMTRKLGEYLQEKNVSAYLHLNLRIHDRIWQACSNKTIHETLTGLMEKIAMFRMQAEAKPLNDPAAMEQSYQDHQDLLKGIETKDLDLLERIIATHWGGEPRAKGSEAGAEARPSDRFRAAVAGL